MKITVSLLILWATTADLRVINGDNPMLSSPMKQKFARQFSFHDSRNVDIEATANCVQNYSPCSCTVDPPNPAIFVTCENVTVENVRNVFQRVNDSEIYELYLFILPSSDTNIVSVPADFLGNTSVTYRITISGNLTINNLVIDPLAFRASQNTLLEFHFYDWDFGLQRDFSFLNGFNKLQVLWIEFSRHLIGIQYLPRLPSLGVLYLLGCTGLITFPDLSYAKMQQLWVEYNSITDSIADEIVALLVANSTESLFILSFSNNYLTRIPNQLGSPFAFPNLLYLDLAENYIKTIENDTFQGIFTTSNPEYVSLYSNELVVFEEAVYKEMLEQIEGSLDVRQNDFACGCDMAWLIRDNRNLLSAVSGDCGINSPFPNVSFEDLDPRIFVTFCPPSSMNAIRK